MAAIRLRGVSKRFWISHEKPALARRLLPGLLGPRQVREHWALRDITLELDSGTSLGVMGPNGSGKTTLLSLMAGITQPTTGAVSVRGRVATLLSLGGGFHPELTGRENLFLNGAVLGLGMREMRRKFDAIVAFSELDAFMDAPLYTYSAGMQLRLGFAIAIHTDADVLLIDEMLAVGDLAFQQRCLTQLQRFRQQGRLLVVVSQTMELHEQLCDRVVLLEGGRLIADGAPQTVVACYRQLSQEHNASLSGRAIVSAPAERRPQPPPEAVEQEGAVGHPETLAARASLPRVSSFIVNYNGVHWLSRCLESVLALSYPRDRCEVVVVDNGSTDESQDMVRARFPDVRWLVNDVNNYCRANNLGVRQANGDLIAFVNSDAWLAPDWLRTLVGALGDDPQLAGVTGKTFLGKGPLLYSTGHEALADDYWRDRGLWQDDGPRYDRAAEVPGVSGCASLYRRRSLDAVGGMDEAFVMYYEDVDLGIRCRQRGWRFGYVPQAVAYHQFHGTASHELGQFFVERNRLLLVAKHAPEGLPGALRSSQVLLWNGRRQWLSQYAQDLQRMLRREHGEQGAELVWPGVVAAYREVDRPWRWRGAPSAGRIMAGLRRRLVRVAATREADGRMPVARGSTTSGLGWRLAYTGDLPHLVFERPEGSESARSAARTDSLRSGSPRAMPVGAQL